MKMKLWTVLIAVISTTVMADQAIVRPAGSTEGASAAPTAAPAARRSSAAAAAALRTVPLVPGPATVSANRVNVRGQAKLNSEIITRMTNGESVMVLEEITLKRSGPDEPSAWAKIALPEKANPWVHSSYIDPATKTVIPKKLNLRGGPGENYSVLGSLEKGATVKEITTKDNWIQIERPETAYAFIAAQYLKQEGTTEPPTVASAPTDPPTVISEDLVIAPAPTDPLANQVAIADPPTPTLPEPAETFIVPEPEPEAVEPAPPRIVQREGSVRATVSIQAATPYALIGDTGKTINYLHTTSPDLDLARYKGMRIIVTGEEGLDKRWRNTPVITVQSIQVLE